MDDLKSECAKGSLLVVDDELSARKTIEAFLTREGYEVRCAPNGRTALMFAIEDPPELVLLDIRMPEMNGFEVCRRLKEDRRTESIPVIFLSALDEVVDKVKGFAAGGVDYITKPFQADEVLARVETHLTLSRLQKQIVAQNVQLEQEVIKSRDAEEKLRQAAEEWRTTFDSITDPVSIHDRDFRLIRANKAFAAAFGMEIREVLGKRCYEVVHGTEEPWPLCPHRQTLESGEAVTEEFFEPRLGKFLQMGVSPLLNGKKELIGSVHISKDVTGRKRAEEMLRRSEERFRNLVETMGDWVWEVDANGVYTYASPRVYDLLGYQPEEVIGKTPFDFMPPDERKRISSVFAAMKSQGKSFSSLENVNQHKDGHMIVLETTGVPFFDTGDVLVGYRGIDRDITERKNAEAALRKAHDELEARVKERTAELAVANAHLVAFAKNLEDRLKFESVLAEISGRFVNLPVDQVMDEIKNAQRRVCEFLQFDRSTLWLVPEEGQETLRLIHVHPAPGDEPFPEKMDARDFFPWSTQKVLNGEVLTLLRIADLPPEAARDQESYRRYGTKSVLVIPLSAGGRNPFGAMSWARTQEEQEWPDSALRGLQLVTQLFANALARKRAEEALRSSEERLSLAADSAQIGLWSMDISTRRLWNSGSSWELLGLDRGVDLTEQVFFSLVHAEDRERLRQAVEEGVESGSGVRVQYRVVHPDGNIRWIISHARLHCNASGEPDSLMGVSIDITEPKRMEAQLREQLQEIEKLKERLEQENIYLQKEVKFLVEHTEIVGQSAVMKRVLAQAAQVAPTESTVLLLGETGTGKELLARAIHDMSSRKERPLVTINCASLPPTLIESELFGREKGAYTGALTKLVGRFEIADGSTLFLDEIGEFPYELQSKLLRVLETGNFERLGSTRGMHIDVRLIAATNRDLSREVAEGKFRRDLFYRLNVFPIVMPPLRDRPEDIPLLVWAFVNEFQKRMGKEVENISKKSMEALQSYPWPGNIRELRNVVERAMIVSRSKTLVIPLPDLPASEMPFTGNLEDADRKLVLSVLQKTGWRVGGKGGAAEILGLKRSTLYSKMKKLGIKLERPTF